MPIASTILMVRPASFAYNPETAVNNHFQTDDGMDVQQAALLEFDTMAETLREAGIQVLVAADSPVPPKPSAIFPNNWISTSPDGVVSVFPLFAPNRRPEKRDDIIQMLAAQFVVRDVQDWSEFEAEGRFLEGTGSMVIDHDNQLIYAAVSERTSLSVLEKFAATTGYQAIVFLATDLNGDPVYHTNVVMALGDRFCILCEASIEEEWELIAVRQLLESTGHRIIPITREQMHAFAGNMLLLKNKAGAHLLVLSKTAQDALTQEQLKILTGYATLLPVAVPTIEKAEGGSVRCMMAEIFLQPKESNGHSPA